MIRFKKKHNVKTFKPLSVDALKSKYLTILQTHGKKTRRLKIIEERCRQIRKSHLVAFCFNHLHGETYDSCKVREFQLTCRGSRVGVHVNSFMSTLKSLRRVSKVAKLHKLKLLINCWNAIKYESYERRYQTKVISNVFEALRENWILG